MDSKKKEKEREREKRKKKEKDLRDNTIRWKLLSYILFSIVHCRFVNIVFFFSIAFIVSRICISLVIYCVLRINSKANARDRQTIMIHSFNYLSRSTMRSMIYDYLQLRSVSVTTRQYVGVGELVIVKRWQRLDREDKLCHLRTMIAIIAIVVSR